MNWHLPRLLSGEHSKIHHHRQGEQPLLTDNLKQGKS